MTKAFYETVITPSTAVSWEGTHRHRALPSPWSANMPVVGLSRTLRQSGCTTDDCVTAAASLLGGSEPPFAAGDRVVAVANGLTWCSGDIMEMVVRKSKTGAAPFATQVRVHFDEGMEESCAASLVEPPLACRPFPSFAARLVWTERLTASLRLLATAGSRRRYTRSTDARLRATLTSWTCAGDAMPAQSKRSRPLLPR